MKLPSRISTIEGGMIVPNVPALHTIPAASRRSYRAASMVGSAKSPIVRTVAPMAPVVGARNTLTKTAANIARARTCGSMTRSGGRALNEHYEIAQSVGERLQRDQHSEGDKLGLQ